MPLANGPQAPSHGQVDLISHVAPSVPSQPAQRIPCDRLNARFSLSTSKQAQLRPPAAYKLKQNQRVVGPSRVDSRPREASSPGIREFSNRTYRTSADLDGRGLSNGIYRPPNSVVISVFRQPHEKYGKMVQIYRDTEIQTFEKKRG